MVGLPLMGTQLCAVTVVRYGTSLVKAETAVGTVGIVGRFRIDAHSCAGTLFTVRDPASFWKARSPVGRPLICVQFNEDLLALVRNPRSLVNWLTSVGIVGLLVRDSQDCAGTVPAVRYPASLVKYPTPAGLPVTPAQATDPAEPDLLT